MDAPSPHRCRAPAYPLQHERKFPMSDQKLEILIEQIFTRTGTPFGKEDVAKMASEIRAAAPTAVAAGEHVGQQAGEGMSHALEHHLKVHVANMIGQVLGAPGVGRLAALGAG